MGILGSCLMLTQVNRRLQKCRHCRLLQLWYRRRLQHRNSSTGGLQELPTENQEQVLVWLAPDWKTRAGVGWIAGPPQCWAAIRTRCCAAERHDASGSHASLWRASQVVSGQHEAENWLGLADWSTSWRPAVWRSSGSTAGVPKLFFLPWREKNPKT